MKLGNEHVCSASCLKLFLPQVSPIRCLACSLLAHPFKFYFCLVVIPSCPRACRTIFEVTKRCYCFQWKDTFKAQSNTRTTIYRSWSLSNIHKYTDLTWSLRRQSKPQSAGTVPRAERTLPQDAASLRIPRTSGIEITVNKKKAKTLVKPNQT